MIIRLVYSSILPVGFFPKVCITWHWLRAPYVKKPWVYKGEIVAGDILKLTILFDHDVIDGAPAARFVQILTDRLQAAYGWQE